MIINLGFLRCQSCTGISGVSLHWGTALWHPLAERLVVSYVALVRVYQLRYYKFSINLDILYIYTLHNF